MPGNMMLARRIKDAVVPATTGTMAVLPTGATNGIQLTSDTSTAGSLTGDAAYVEVVAANAITSDFRITSIGVDSFSAATRFHIVIATGAASSETVVGTVLVMCGATADAPTIPVTMPNIPANTRVSMKCAVQCGTSRTCRVNMNYVTV